MNYIDLVKVASFLMEEEDFMDKQAGIGAVRKAHKSLLKNTARAAAGTKSAIKDLREQGLLAQIPMIPNEAPVEGAVAKSNLALLGLAPTKPGKGRSISKQRQALEKPSKTTKAVLKDTAAPSVKVKGMDGSVRTEFNKDFGKDLRAGIDEAQAARETAKNIDHQFARNIRRGRAGLVPVDEAAPGKSKKGLYALLAALGLTGAGAGTAAGLLGGNAAAAATPAAAGLGLGALGTAGAAGLAGAGLTYAGLSAIPAMKKKRILRAAMAMLGGGAAAYGGLQALNKVAPKEA